MWQKSRITWIILEEVPARKTLETTALKERPTTLVRIELAVTDSKESALPIYWVTKARQSNKGQHSEGESRLSVSFRPLFTTVEWTGFACQKFQITRVI